MFPTGQPTECHFKLLTFSVFIQWNQTLGRFELQTR
jgi:hypothetical protein